MLEEQEYDLHVHHKGYINAVTHNVPTSGSKCENDFSVSSVILFPLKSLKREHVAYLIQNNTRYIDIEAAGGILKSSHLTMTTYISVKMPPLPGLNTDQSGGDVKPQFLILLQKSPFRKIRRYINVRCNSRAGKTVIREYCWLECAGVSVSCDVVVVSLELKRN